MLELCINCSLPVVLYNPNCSNHVASQEQKNAVKLPKDKRTTADLSIPHLTKETVSLEQLAQAVCEVASVELSELCAGASAINKELASARRLYMFIGVLRLHYSRVAVSNYLNLSLPSISIGLGKAHHEIAEKKTVRAKYEQILGRMQADFAAIQNPGT